MQYIDLSMPLTPSTPVYPGDPKVEIKVVGELAKDGYLDHVLTVGTHNGTHIDAPAHMLANGKMISDYGPADFIGRGVLVNALSGLTLDALKQVDLKRDDIVLIRTGFSDTYDLPGYAEKVPDFPIDAAKHLAEIGVKMVGIDAITPDEPPFPFHKTLFETGILLAENLRNLAKLEGKSFTIYALPLNVEIEAAPARIIASID
jgi:kynurenine formamidase